MHDMNKMQNKRQNPTTEGITYHIAENGKSWRYKDGKLHPGCYNNLDEVTLTTNPELRRKVPFALLVERY